MGAIILFTVRVLLRRRATARAHGAPRSQASGQCAWGVRLQAKHGGAWLRVWDIGEHVVVPAHQGFEFEACGMALARLGFEIDRKSVWCGWPLLPLVSQVGRVREQGGCAPVLDVIRDDDCRILSVGAATAIER